MNFIEKLNAACDERNSLVCVGLDVNRKSMPACVSDVFQFNKAIIDTTFDAVCAYKPNLAFYEALGFAGFEALDETIKYIRDVAPNSIIIGDGKRGDISSTTEAYVAAMFEVWGFDAVTINPLGGMDTVEPWLSDPERGVFICCRTSNPGAADLLDLTVCDSFGNAEKVYIRLARAANKFAGQGNVGLVVGATAPEQLSEVRGFCPNLPFLIPGVGAQGGDLKSSVLNGVDNNGRLAIINSSRRIIYASSGPDFADAARIAATELRDSINQILSDAGLGWGQTSNLATSFA